MTRANTYAEITREVAELIDRHVENDPTVAAYMIARASMLQVRGLRGSAKAAELCYSIADELAGEGAG